MTPETQAALEWLRDQANAAESGIKNPFAMEPIIPQLQRQESACRIAIAVIEKHGELRRQLDEANAVIARAVERIAQDSSPGRDDWTEERTQQAVMQLIRDANNCITWGTADEREAHRLDLAYANRVTEESEARVRELEERFERLFELLDSVTYDNADVAQKIMTCFPNTKCLRMRGDGAPNEGREGT